LTLALSFMEKSVLPVLEFYDQLSDSYDQMISWPTRIGTEGSFFKKLTTDYKIKSSLDIACSTGFHVIMFRRLGLDAVGVDASPKMIEKARANAVTCGVTVEFILGDFTTLSKRFSEGFDIITCLGDTISHLRTKPELKKALQEIYKCLNPGGLFVLQNRNYDHLIRNRIRFFPPTGSRNGSEETLFFRLLDFNPKSIDFSIVTFHRHENRWDSVVRTAEIFPYFKNDLEGLLRGVGFKRTDFYRNFNFEDYDKNGPDLIVVCEKKGTLKGKLPAKNAASLGKANRAKVISPKAREVMHSKPSPRVSPQRQHPASSKEMGKAIAKSTKPRRKKSR
jgi:glycine/sarcosine N-methyltransferase